MKPAAHVTVIFLVLVALIHLLRLLFRVEVTVASTTMPLWLSLFALVGPAALATWLWREQRARPRPTAQ